jgi:hypothetical protein
LGKLVALPRVHKPAEVDKMVVKATSKAKHRNETAVASWKVWMPYHRIWIACSYIDESREETVATALNAMFCASARTERELLQLFRPKHLDKPLEEIVTGPDEIVLPYPSADLNKILDKLIKTRTEARDRLSQIETELVKTYRRMQWRYLLLPTSTGTLEREGKASAKFAELQSTSLAVDICLNLTTELLPRKVERLDVFYAPMAVVLLKRDDGTGRYVLIDLTTGKVDDALTNLCELNDDFKSRLELVLGRSE